MTDDVHRLRAELVLAGLGMVALLWERWQAGAMTVEALRELLPDVWLYREWPEMEIGQPAWLSMLSAAGFLSYPAGWFAPPTAEQVLYRGATPDRVRGIAWATDPETAAMYASRRRRMGSAAQVYEATVGPERVLATFRRSDDLRVEVLVDPRQLAVREIADDPSRT